MTGGEVAKGTATGTSFDFSHAALEPPGRVLKFKQGGELHGRLWPSSLALGQYLCETPPEHPHSVKGKTVCEVGAGLGLVGVVASCLGATHVALTDLVDAIPGLEEHRSLNDLENVVCETLCWGNDDDHAKLSNPKVDIILAADVIYFPGEELASELINTFRRLCKPDTVILLAHEFRGDWVDDMCFFDGMQEHFDSEFMPMGQWVEPFEGKLPGITNAVGDPDDYLLYVYTLKKAQ